VPHRIIECSLTLSFALTSFRRVRTRRSLSILVFGANGWLSSSGTVLGGKDLRRVGLSPRTGAGLSRLLTNVFGFGSAAATTGNIRTDSCALSSRTNPSFEDFLGGSILESVSQPSAGYGQGSRGRWGHQGKTLVDVRGIQRALREMTFASSHTPPAHCVPRSTARESRHTSHPKSEALVWRPYRFRRNSIAAADF